MDALECVSRLDGFLKSQLSIAQYEALPFKVFDDARKAGLIQRGASPRLTRDYLDDALMLDHYGDEKWRERVNSLTARWQAWVYAAEHLP